MLVGYIGAINNDVAAGVENFVATANALARRGVDFRFSVIGSGAGMGRLQRLVGEAGHAERFVYHGFLPIEEAFGLIVDFDFGLLSLPDIPRNHMHTAGKAMDYMCCGVPVCSLELAEQLFTTGGIGVHGSSFEEIVEEMVDVYRDEARYEELRRRTLERFNEVLAWETQAEILRKAYDTLWTK
jgi:glycosyltransferase involved in cell wall biosynthesis